MNIHRWKVSLMEPIEYQENSYAEADWWEGMLEDPDPKRDTFVWDQAGWRYMGQCTQDEAFLYLNDFSHVDWDGLVWGEE